MRFQRETLARAWNEILPLAQRHHTEHTIPWSFDPQRALYETLEQAGLLWILTARAVASDRLDGYAVFTLTRHPHIACKMAVQDTVYMVPECRGVGAGKFLLWCDKQMLDGGADQIMRMVPAAHDWSSSLERMGYQFVDKVMVRRA
jgi:hypothetical protein